MPVVSFARAHTEEAIAVLVDIMRCGEKEASRLAAAIALLNRGWGTPPQSMIVHGEIKKEFDMSQLSREELAQFNTMLSKITEAEVVPDDEPTPTGLKVVNSPQPEPGNGP